MKTFLDDPASTAFSLTFSYKIASSAAFFQCLDTQVTDLFITATGLKPSKNVSLSFAEPDDGSPIYVKGSVSRLNIFIFINHVWNPISIAWKSKSGRTYDISDTDIDCNDIEFSIEGLDAELYHRQLFPNDKLPFRMKDLSFELVVTRLTGEPTLTIQVQEASISDTESIMHALYNFIDGFNIKSESKDRKDGVVHNYKATVSEPGVIEMEIDLGSAGVPFYKKLLTFMSKMGSFARVEIG